MVSAKIALLASAAILSEVAMATPHKLLHARDEVVYNVVVKTVYVTAPAATAAATAAAVPEAQAPAPEVNTPKKEVVQETKTEGSGSGSLSTKRGAVFNNEAYGNPFLGMCNKKCGWFHNWNSAYSGQHSGSFVPTMWGDKADHPRDWPANWKKAYDAGSRNFFSFNEPDILPEHAGDVAIRLEPAQAVDQHVKFFSDLPKDARIATPSVTNGENAITTGLEWLKQFVVACNANSNCRFDFCNVHAYYAVDYLDNIWAHLEKASEVCNTGNNGAKKKVWLTEFGTRQLTTNQVKADWLSTALPKLEAAEHIEGYSYFWAAPTVGGGEPGFMLSPDSLAADGQVYIQ